MSMVIKSFNDNINYNAMINNRMIVNCKIKWQTIIYSTKDTCTLL